MGFNSHDISVLSRSVCHHGLGVKAQCPICLSQYEQTKRDSERRTTVRSVKLKGVGGIYDVNEPPGGRGRPWETRYQGNTFRCWGVESPEEARTLAENAWRSLHGRPPLF